MADSDHYTFSPYPSTMQQLIVDGDDVGQHYTMINGDGATVYCARILSSRDLPVAAVTSHRRSLDEALRRLGPKQKLGDALDKLYEARSDAFPFPRELMGLVGDPEPHAKLSRNDVFVRTLPNPGVRGHPGGMVVIDVVLRDEREDLRHAIELSKLLARSTKRICDEDRRYRDAYEVLTGTDGRGEPSPEQLEQVMKHLASATSWVTGQPARVGDAIETRLHLSEVSELEGTLHIYWLDPALSEVNIHLDGGLPKTPGAAATLAPEEGGLWAFLKTLGELKVGDPELDDAFFIKAEDGDRTRTLLLHSRDHLVELGRFGAHVEFAHEQLRVRVDEVEYSASNVAALVGTLLELWRRTVLFRAGLAGAQDPTA